MTPALTRAALRESARLRAVAQDCRVRIGWLVQRAAAARRSARRLLEPERLRPGEVRVSIDSGDIVAAWLLVVGGSLVAATAAYVVAWVVP